MNKNSKNGKTLQVLPLSSFNKPKVTLDDFPKVNVLFSHPPIYFDVLKNIKPHLESFPTKGQRVVNTIFKLDHVFGSLRASHEYIAKQAGVGESTVRRTLKRMRELGMITWKQFTRSTNEYFIATWTQAMPFRQRFAYLFPALLAFSSYTLYTPRVLCTGSTWRALRPLNERVYNKENTLKGMDISFKDNNPLSCPDYFGFMDQNVLLDLPERLIDEKKIENRECGDGQLCQTCRKEKRERKKEMEMNEASIPSYVEAIKVLTLTPRGKAELSQYHQEAIEFACKQIIKREVDNPFTYFSKICKNYSLEHSLPINFVLFKNLSIKLGIGQSDPHLVEGTGINKPKSKDKSGTNYPVWNPPADMFVYDELSDPEKLKYLFSEAQAVYDLQACSPCKELKKPCPQTAVNPFKDALLDLQKQLYSTTGYKAEPLSFHVKNRLLDTFSVKKCPTPPSVNVQLSSTIDYDRIDRPTPTPQDYNLLP